MSAMKTVTAVVATEKMPPPAPKSKKPIATPQQQPSLQQLPAFPPKLVFPTYSNGMSHMRQVSNRLLIVLISKQSYVQVVNDKQTIVNNNIFCIVPPQGTMALPSHQKMHLESSKKRKRTQSDNDKKERKAKRARHDAADAAFVEWVQTLSGEELNLSKKLSGKFVEESLNKLNWKNEQNVAYLAEHLPMSVTSLNFTFFTTLSPIFWKHLFCPERITSLDCSGILHFSDPAVFKQLTGVKSLSLSTVNELLANKLIMPQLKKLCLNDIPHANDATVLNFLSILKQVSNCDLELLELNNNRIVGAMFASLPLLFAGLQSLEVSYQEIAKHSMTAAHLCSLLQLPKLKHLSLYDNQLADEAIQVLAKCQHDTLESLDIGGNPISDMSLLSLLTACTHLVRLNVEDTNVNMCKEVRTVVQAHRTLQYVNVRGCASDKELLDVVAECATNTRTIVIV